MRLSHKQRFAYLTADELQTLTADQVIVPDQGRNFSLRKLFKRLAIFLLVVLLSFGGWMGWKLYSDTVRLTGNKNPLQLFGAFSPSPLKESNGRVNILLAGYSDDDPNHQGADLTDSIMILSLDTQNKNVVVISVPRDLYVKIPGYGYSKINAAYEYGQQGKFNEDPYPSGGMGLLEKTVSQDFGIDFGYYALINYAAVKDAVNAVGGVTVTINSSNPKGLYDPNTSLRLPNGTQTLDGQTALNLTRSRGDGYGSYGFPQADFNRTQNQQMLLLALKDKASQSNVIANPFKAGEIADAVGNNIKTDLQLSEMRTLYYYSKQMNDSNIKTVSLNNYNGTNLLRSYTTASGQSALIPADGVNDFTSIQKAVQALLAPPTNSNN